MHWDITGKGSYATHISLDEAITDLWDATDRMIETTYASLGNLHIIIPETIKPNDHLSCVSLFYDHIETKRGLFAELFTQSIIDDYQEAIKQLLYRLKRLS
jgi:DNA-binding ferritin-like protein